jgi:hypothetical protein
MIRVTIPSREKEKHKGKRRVMLQIGKYQFHLANFEVYYLIRELRSCILKVDRKEEREEAVNG